MTTTRATERLVPETDAFTFVVLGLLARLQGLEAVAREPSDTHPCAREAASIGSAAPTKHDDLTMAVLGLCSVRRSVERWLVLAARDEPEPPIPRTPRALPRDVAR